MNKFNKKSGFTLIEVVIGMGIFSLVIVSLLSLVTSSTLGLKNSQYRLFTSIKTEAIKEWLWGEKEKNWQLFISKSDGKTYCLTDDFASKNISDSQPLTASECGETPSHFLHSFKLEKNGESIRSTISVSYKLNSKIVSSNTFTFDYTQHD